MSIDRFIRSLVDYQSEDVFNPYCDMCPDYDRRGAPRVRCANLRYMLKAVRDRGAKTIWVARDLGYRGGRRTGLALTDEAHLGHAGQMLGTNRIVQATKGAPLAERTATVVWEMLARIDEPVMLWNVFPFHPHEKGIPMSNRSHTRRERNDALPFLLDLIELVLPQKLVAIGRDAAIALEDLSVPVHLVRHPSYGGQTLFIEQMEALYGLRPKGPQQPDLLMAASRVA